LDVAVAVHEVSSGKSVLVDWTVLDTNRVTVGPFAQAPTTNQYRVFVFSGSGQQGATGPTGPAGTMPSFDAVIGGISGLVHRWKFTETSGNFADSVGSLTLTAAGTFTYNTGSPRIGGAVLLGASATATSSGLGSIPTGNNPRCIVAVFKPTDTTQQALFGYGAAATDQGCVCLLNYNGADVILFSFYTDDLSISNSGSVTNQWHIAIFNYDTSPDRRQQLMIDGLFASRTTTAVVNTATTGNFVVGQWTATYQGTFYIDDLAVFNRALAPWEIRKLINALQ
jgi:hypothetical protein